MVHPLSQLRPCFRPPRWALFTTAPYHRPVAIDSVVLAHQGGWDEILLVAGPLVLLWLLLVLANRRAKRLGNDDANSDA